MQRAVLLFEAGRRHAGFLLKHPRKRRVGCIACPFSSIAQRVVWHDQQFLGDFDAPAGDVFHGGHGHFLLKDNCKIGRADLVMKNRDIA